jgi:ADP-ribose pyrophosphatase
MKPISSVEKFACSLFSVHEEVAVAPDGFQITRNVIHHAGSAVMMAVDNKKRILLVRQYRMPARKYLWELPAGKIDEGETALQAAKRELIEETGYRAKQWKKIATYYASPGFLGEKMNLYLATDLVEGEARPMEDERIERRWFTAKELDSMVESMAIQDGKTLIGFLAWKRYFSRAKR